MSATDKKLFSRKNKGKVHYQLYEAILKSKSEKKQDWIRLLPADWPLNNFNFYMHYLFEALMESLVDSHETARNLRTYTRDYLKAEVLVALGLSEEGNKILGKTYTEALKNGYTEIAGMCNRKIIQQQISQAPGASTENHFKSLKEWMNPYESLANANVKAARAQLLKADLHYRIRLSGAMKKEIHAIRRKLNALEITAHDWDLEAGFHQQFTLLLCAWYEGKMEEAEHINLNLIAHINNLPQEFRDKNDMLFALYNNYGYISMRLNNPEKLRNSIDWLEKLHASAKGHHQVRTYISLVNLKVRLYLQNPPEKGIHRFLYAEIEQLESITGKAPRAEWSFVLVNLSFLAYQYRVFPAAVRSLALLNGLPVKELDVYVVAAGQVLYAIALLAAGKEDAWEPMYSGWMKRARFNTEKRTFWFLRKIIANPENKKEYLKCMFEELAALSVHPGEKRLQEMTDIPGLLFTGGITQLRYTGVG